VSGLGQCLELCGGHASEGVLAPAAAAPGVGDAGALGERLGRQRVAGKLIETDLHQPYLDGVTAHIDRG
jgi:hypothetical protein